STALCRRSCSNTLSSTDFTRLAAAAGGRRTRRFHQRQAGCMVKTDKRRKTSPRFPAQIDHAVRAAEDKQAAELVVLDLRKAAGFTDFFVICSGNNARQIRAIADAVMDTLADENVKPAHIEGYD